MTFKTVLMIILTLDYILSMGEVFSLRILFFIFNLIPTEKFLYFIL